MPKTQHQPTLDIDTIPAKTADQQERDRVREEYRARLAEKLKDPEFRKIEGFPLGTDEAILALSDPPYYTACPNPFLEEWLAENAKPYDAATDDYHREPFAADVSEGKNDPIYNAHSYHTKVPHKAIMRYILHYTEPGDVVYDGFCGTGMTGVAAQMCGNKAQVESLGYTVQDDGAILDTEGNQISHLGARKAILNDLSPAATFIAYNYNTPVDAAAFRREARRILSALEAECGWMYMALHDADPVESARVAEAINDAASVEEVKAIYKDLRGACSLLRSVKSQMKVGRINYTVWSDVLVCPVCGSEIVFWDAAFDTLSGRVSDDFPCPHCRAHTTKKKSSRATMTLFDDKIGVAITSPKQVPVRLNYTVDGVRHERGISASDIALNDFIARTPNSLWFPTTELPYMHMTHERAKMSARGITHLHHFHIPRAMRSLSALWQIAQEATDERLKRFMLFMAEQTIWGLSKMNRYGATHFSQANRYMNGVYYVASLSSETTPWYILDGKAKRLAQAFSDYLPQYKLSITTTGSCSTSIVPPNSVEYIFTDPPFGENIYYADLNYLVESWHGVITDSTPEAIVDRAKKKRIAEYQEKMTTAFRAYYRALRPGRWMTVEFSNSSNAVWNAIQEGLERVGFVVADIRVLNKQSGSYRQVTAVSAVKEDLVISCYKPHSKFEQRFQQIKGQPEGVLEFVRQHLSMLPIAPVTKGGKLEPVAERTRFLLFDRMIAYHLQRGAPIPMNSAAFYKLLEDQFTTRDEMYFLPDQAARFDALKSRGYETEQLSIFLQDEKSAVQWVRAALTETPQTLGDLTPKFMQELREWPAHEPRPELRDLLREYFIHSDDGVWRVPNPDDEKDIEALRKNALLRLFQGYTKEKGALKTFRKEAVLEGFKQCYETNQYGVIVSVCEKIPAKVFQEIPEFVMFYDIAKDLAPERVEQIEFVWE
jgi:DNA modification methylase